MKRTLVLIAGAMACSMASAQVTFYNSSGSWDAARIGGGHTILVGMEDYEQSSLPPGSVLGINDPLTTGVANGSFANGLLHPNLTVQSNLDPTGATANNPRGANGLAIFSVGFFGAVSDIVVPDVSIDSFDTMFGAGGVSAVGFDTVDFAGNQTGVVAKVFGAGNVFLGMTTSPANPAGSNFLGMVSTVAIERINIWSTGGGLGGWDNMSSYNPVPEPASMIALGLGAVVLLRRRRKA